MTQIHENDLSALKQFACLHQLCRQHGDTETASRCAAYYARYKDEQHTVLAFCGHFSAGKSSLLNEILGSQLLPATPIPTSGNLVRIQSGTPATFLQTRAGEQLSLPADYSIEKLRDWLRDTETIQRIDLRVDNGLPRGAVLLDTPGVDSTDSRHRAATEEALHMADAVFYVTDYNHVLSSVNYSFLSKLQQLRKPYYLIINQIDKHDLNEGTFADFLRYVTTTFAERRIAPTRIFCLSLRAKEQPGNDYHALLAFIGDLMNSGLDQETRAANERRDLRQVAAAHQHFLDARLEEQLRACALTHVPDYQAAQDAEEAVAKREEEREALKGELIHWRVKAEKLLSQVVESAILTPYTVREAAAAYLQMLDPQFKTGWFTRQKKIVSERQTRLDRLMSVYQKQEQTLEWAVNDTFNRLANAVQLEPPIVSFAGLASSDLMKDIQESAAGSVTMNGDYLLHYAERLSGRTKQRVLKLANQTLDTLVLKQHAVCQQAIDEVEAKLAGDKRRLASIRSIRAEKAKVDQAANFMEEMLSGSSDWPESGAAQEELMQIVREQANQPVISLDAFRRKYRQLKASHEQNSEPVVARVRRGRGRASDAEVDGSRALQQAAASLKTLPGFKETAEQLARAAARLQQKTFTIALFGAFSAGKSSFANALLGTALLPVSANPTTAVINRIQRPDADHAHGRAVVQWKQADDLLHEVNQILYFFDCQIIQLDELAALVTKLKPAYPELKWTPQLAYLQTLSEAIGSAKLNWGTVEEMALELVRQKIADEHIACLIDNVTMYFDCPFTRQGAVLVDTPGSNSVYARHTEVAFQWIKHADAILFLTYFNHAFSQADSEFLIQLGRVKGLFTIDKMFFIINAIDLAQNEAERGAVLDYVREQLLTRGVRQPKLYGVSSKHALQELQKGAVLTAATGFPAFLEDWKIFTEDSLQQQVVASGLALIWQAANQIRDLLSDLQLEGAEKERRVAELHEQKRALHDALRDLPTNPRELAQHIDEWFFYMKKRLMQRAHDEFAQYFNPSVFFERAQSPQTILHQSLKEWLDFLSFDFDQECRATFLRCEAQLKKECADLSARCSALCANEGLSLTAIAQQMQVASPRITRHLKENDSVTRPAALKIYKNTKQFFENDGAARMRAALEDWLEPQVTAILEENRTECAAHYHQQLGEAVAQIKHYYQEQMAQSVARTLQIFEGETGDAHDRLTEVLAQLTELSVQ
ncbi:MAG: dynamin family protein [Sporolactobacillus sp.]